MSRSFSSFPPTQNGSGTCLRGVFQRDKRGRFLPRSDDERTETLALRIAQSWGIAPSTVVDGRRLDAHDLPTLRRINRFGSHDEFLSWKEAQYQRQMDAESFDPRQYNPRGNPQRRSSSDGSLEIRYCRGPRGRFLPNPPVGDVVFPWEIGSIQRNPGFHLAGRSDEILNLILERFKDPASLPGPLAQVFVHNESSHASRLSLANQFIIALHGEWEAMGFRQWEAVGRHVRKGGKGFRILAPMTRKIGGKDASNTDPSASDPSQVASRRFDPKPDRKHPGQVVVGFRDVVVFGLSQTDGKDYALTRDDAFLAGLPYIEVARSWGLAVQTYTGDGARALGKYSPGLRSIALGTKNAATFTHELIHAADDRLGALNLERYGKDPHVKADAEVVAELGGATLLVLAGREAEADLGGAYAYLKSWAPDGDARLAAFRVLDRVLKAVQLVISTATTLAAGGIDQTSTTGSATPPPMVTASPAPVPEPLPPSLPSPPPVPIAPAVPEQLTIDFNPARRRTKAAGSAVVGLGVLVDLIIRTPDGQRMRVTPDGERWLAWDADRRDLLMLRPGSGTTHAAPAAAARRHAAFHGADPRAARSMEWPEPRGRVRTLGLVESVTYHAAHLRSPHKGRARWLHHFGDRGERGHGPARPNASSPYAERLMPRLDSDAAGNLWIVRRSGNRYTVRDWILA